MSMTMAMATATNTAMTLSTPMVTRLEVENTAMATDMAMTANVGHASSIGLDVSKAMAMPWPKPVPSDLAMFMTIGHHP